VIFPPSPKSGVRLEKGDGKKGRRAPEALGAVLARSRLCGHTSARGETLSKYVDSMLEHFAAELNGGLYRRALRTRQCEWEQKKGKGRGGEIYLGAQILAMVYKALSEKIMRYPPSGRASYGSITTFIDKDQR